MTDLREQIARIIDPVHTANADGWARANPDRAKDVDLEVWAPAAFKAADAILALINQAQPITAPVGPVAALVEEAHKQANGLRQWIKLTPYGKHSDGPHTESLLRALYAAGDFTDRLAAALEAGTKLLAAQERSP